jgi:hypothetical protein
MLKGAAHDISIGTGAEVVDLLHDSRPYDSDKVLTEFLEAFGPDSDFHLDQMTHYHAATNQGLDKSRIRSVYWRLFLGYFENNAFPNRWIGLAQKHRQEYVSLIEEFVVNPQDDSEDLSKNNPLCASKDSKWAQYYKNNELCDVIRLDLTRTHQHLPFFVHPQVQSRMMNILFVWCKVRTLLIVYIICPTNTSYLFLSFHSLTRSTGIVRA